MSYSKTNIIVTTHENVYNEYKAGGIMDNKKHVILNHMLGKNSYSTSEELSKLIKVSPRTVMRYIKDINSLIKRFNAEIVSAKGLGYLLLLVLWRRKRMYQSLKLQQLV